MFTFSSRLESEQLLAYFNIKKSRCCLCPDLKATTPKVIYTVHLKLTVEQRISYTYGTGMRVMGVYASSLDM